MGYDTHIINFRLKSNVKRRELYINFTSMAINYDWLLAGLRGL